jgi:uncharacterized protein YlaI
MPVGTNCKPNAFTMQNIPKIHLNLNRPIQVWMCSRVARKVKSRTALPYHNSKLTINTIISHVKAAKINTIMMNNKSTFSR